MLLNDHDEGRSLVHGTVYLVVSVDFRNAAAALLRRALPVEGVARRNDDAEDDRTSYRGVDHSAGCVYDRRYAANKEQFYFFFYYFLWNRVKYLSFERKFLNNEKKEESETRIGSSSTTNQTSAVDDKETRSSQIVNRVYTVDQKKVLGTSSFLAISLQK